MITAADRLTHDPENEALLEIEDEDDDRLFLWAKTDDHWTITVTDGTESQGVYLKRAAAVVLRDALSRELTEKEAP